MTPGRVHIRRLRPEDREQLRKMFARNAVSEVTRQFHPFPLDSETADRLASYPGRDRYYVAVRDGEILGLAMLRGWDEGYTVPSFGVMVDRGYARQGIGSRLTDFAIEEARRLGSQEIRLTVYESNDIAYRIYQEHEFVESSREKVETSFGEDVRIVMTRPLVE